MYRYGVLVDRWKVLLSSHLPKGFEKFTNPRPTPRQKEEEKEEDDKPTTTTQGSSSSKKEDDGHTTEQDRKDNVLRSVGSTISSIIQQTPRPSRPRSSSTGGDGGGSSGSGKKPQPPSQGINSIQTGLAVGFLLYLMVRMIISISSSWNSSLLSILLLLPKSVLEICPSKTSSMSFS